MRICTSLDCVKFEFECSCQLIGWLQLGKFTEYFASRTAAAGVAEKFEVAHLTHELMAAIFVELVISAYQHADSNDFVRDR
jgi:hypothetical protein